MSMPDKPEGGYPPRPGLESFPEQRRKGHWRSLLSFLVSLALCFILVMLVTRFVLQHNTVIGSSMLPTLEDRDEVFVEKVSRLFPAALKRGDIVTADTYQDQEGREGVIIIKRVVGLPGERVSIREGYVFIDGRQLIEPYLSVDVLTSEHNMAYSDVLLGPDEYYLLGDNRMGSRDSRDIGPVHRSEIEGKLIFRFYPLDKMGKPK